MNLFLDRNLSNNDSNPHLNCLRQTMNILRYSVSVIPLAVVTIASSVLLSAFAQGCPGKKLLGSDPTTTTPTTNPSQTTMVQPGSERDANQRSQFNAATSTEGEQARKVAATIVAIVAGSSTAFLAYKAWTSRKRVYSAILDQPKLEHPELELADLPQEALPQSSELLNIEREAVLTR